MAAFAGWRLGVEITRKEKANRMCQGSTKVAAGDQEPNSESRAIAIAKAGVRTGEECAQLMSALVSAVVEGTMTPQVVNAACNAAGKLLKVVEMQYKYGSRGNEAAKRPFLLMAPDQE
jgi:hypothetical protein